MNKLLVFLLISTMTCVIIEEPHELDDVPLEFSFKDIGDIIKDSADKLKDKVKDKVNEVKDEVKDKVDKVKDKVKDKVNEIKDDVKDKVDKIKDKVKSQADTIKGDIKGQADKIKDDVKDQADKIKDDVKDQADKIKDEIKSIIKKLDGKNPFEEIKGHIKELEKAIKEIRVPVKELQKFFVDKPLEMFKQLNRKVQNGIHWLKVNGYWDPIMDVVKKVGKVAAISLCSVYLTPAICKPAITFVYEAYIKDL